MLRYKLNEDKFTSTNIINTINIQQLYYYNYLIDTQL